MLGLKLGEFCFTKVFGRYVSLSVSIKAKMKKQDKKKEVKIMGYLINPIGFRVGQTRG